MADWMPTTEEVREAFGLSEDGVDFKSAYWDRREAFNRWLDAERRAALVADGDAGEGGCHCPPCPGRGNAGHGMTHCAECCFGSGVEVEPGCPVHNPLCAGSDAPDLMGALMESVERVKQRRAGEGGGAS